MQRSGVLDPDSSSVHPFGVTWLFCYLGPPDSATQPKSVKFRPFLQSTPHPGVKLLQPVRP